MERIFNIEGDIDMIINSYYKYLLSNWEECIYVSPLVKQQGDLIREEQGTQGLVFNLKQATTVGIELKLYLKPQYQKWFWYENLIQFRKIW